MNDYLVQEKSANIDISSCDGTTTPLHHLVCFGGHLKTVRPWIQTHSTNRFMVNDWGCGIGNLVSMAIQEDEEMFISLMNYEETSVAFMHFI